MLDYQKETYLGLLNVRGGGITTYLYEYNFVYDYDYEYAYNSFRKSLLIHEVYFYL
jgi:hypothetical protein